jgi:2-polyprenyl-3-methyl-5-hydroxy-6-metoxy-1,4-benzoquinol methylase
MCHAGAYGSTFVQRQQKLFDDYLKGNGGFERRVKFIFDLAKDVLKGEDLLDIGCGVGTFALAFARKGINAVGLDSSEESIRACELNKKRLEVSNATFVKGNSIDGGIFGRDSFDLIIAADIVEHLSDDILKSTLRNCHKWLRPGGCLIIHTFPTKYYYQTVTVASLSLLPLFFISPKYSETYVKILHYTLFNVISIVVFHKTISRYFLSHGHCNNQHHVDFRNLIEAADFRIHKYQLLDVPLSPLKVNQPVFRFPVKLMKKHAILRSSIAAIAQKA